MIDVGDAGIKREKIRALIDPCCESSILNLRLARRFGDVITHTNVDIAGVSGRSLCSSKVYTNVYIYPPQHYLDRTPWKVEVYGLRNIGITTPTQKLAEDVKRKFEGMELADPEFNLPRGVDAIFGANIYQKIILPGVVSKGALLAQRSAFGWIITGQAPLGYANEISNKVSVFSTEMHGDKFEDLCNQKLLRMIQRFWEIEEVPRSFRCSSSDIECEKIFTTKHFRLSSGRYVVPLPLRESGLSMIGESLSYALISLSVMHRRMEKDPEFGLEYRKFMQTYLEMNHMRLLTSTELASKDAVVNYIPHHGIWQRGDNVKKFRTVFNASRPTATGYSLNDALHVGPKLQTNLVSVLTRFRRHQWAFCTDIKMMFRQILIHPDNIHLQRIVWSSSSKEPVKHYALLTVTYGENCASYLSIRTLVQLCKDEGRDLPEAVSVIEDETYVDDVLSGASKIDDARRKIEQLVRLFKAGGFSAKKWVSNNPEILKDVPVEDHLRSNWLQFAKDGPVTELGVSWDPVQDNFRFPVPVSFSKKLTKRTLTSEMARIFDPAGWLSPVVLTAKLIVQDLWRAKLDWDTDLPTLWAQRWRKFQDSLTHLDQVCIPRWIGETDFNLTDLHVFADASRRAMAAVIYSRVDNGQFETKIGLIAAKTKLESIRSLRPTNKPRPRSTIPRLELRAALLAAKLLRSVAEGLRIPLKRCHAWSDNKTVLCWLHTDGTTGSEYVDGYVSHIHELAPEVTWHHVPTKENPADVASRGAGVQQLVEDTMWWQGPSWLTLHPDNWPHANISNNSAEAGIESSEMATMNCFVTREMAPCKSAFIERFSSLDKLLRAIVNLKRLYRRRIKAETPAPLSPMTADERYQALMVCVRVSQQDHYGPELEKLGHGRSVGRKCRDDIRDLAPFLDCTGIMRAGGRLGNAPLSYDQKFPVIISGRSHLAYLIIHWAHEYNAHAGFRGTFTEAIQLAWIVGEAARVRAFLRGCVECKKGRGKPMQQAMGLLPAVRVTPTPPFSKCGVDFAGPFQILRSEGRHPVMTKGYIALFVCMSTKAITLELASDLSTTKFLAALDRLNNRRGPITEMWSDNASNFRGADVELKKMLQNAGPDWKLVENQLSKKGIMWHFIPPGAPHFGGLWEAGVKSAKRHLKMLIGDRHLTYEEFATLLTHVERILNCRPLGPLSGDPEDMEVLTPSHLMNGRRLSAIPRPSNTTDFVEHLTHWKLVDKIRDHFWKRWSREYLNTLRQRTKLTPEKPNISVNDMVVVIDPSLLRPNGEWPLGRVLEIHPGKKDHLVRVATVRTANGVYVRNLNKLSLLPVERPRSQASARQ